MIFLVVVISLLSSLVAFGWAGKKLRRDWTGVRRSRCRYYDVIGVRHRWWDYDGMGNLQSMCWNGNWVGLAIMWVLCSRPRLSKPKPARFGTTHADLAWNELGRNSLGRNGLGLLGLSRAI